MKILLSIIICLFVDTETSFTITPKDCKSAAQILFQNDTITSAGTLLITTKPDSFGNNKIINTVKVDSGRIIITVDPLEANDAHIMLIQKSQIKVDSFSSTTHAIIPDTLGIWNAPLALQLSLGGYSIVLHKEGFKEVVKEYKFKNNWDSISIEMFSLAYLKHKREQWRSVKWISGGVAFVAGVASYYFHNRISTYKEEYEGATSPSVIQDKRDRMNSSRSYYRISSDISFTAIGSFSISWFIENLY